MIREHIWFLFLMAVCLAVSGTCAAQDDEEFENLVQNADFEDFSYEPWEFWVEDASAEATISVDRSESLTGVQSLLIDVGKRGGGMRVELHQNPFSLENGQRLTYAFWAKTEEGEVRPAKMIVNHRADPWTSYAYKEITITEEWTEFFAPVVMTANDTIVGIYVELRDTVGKVWFDRFRLYEGDYIEEDLDELPDKAVEPRSKLSTTWAAIRISR